jgi:hypothetical protein
MPRPKRVPLETDVRTTPPTIWHRYAVALQMTGAFGASIPMTPSEIKHMLAHRAPTHMPDGGVPLAELADRVMEEVGVDEEDSETWTPGGATFPRLPSGELCYEGRCIRGHLKDAARAISEFFLDVPNFRSKFVNRVYIEEILIPLGRKDPDGMITRYIQVMTRRGPRSAIKFVHYVTGVVVPFTLCLSADGMITPVHVQTALEYGRVHGMGAERSEDWGRYEVMRFERLE